MIADLAADHVAHGGAESDARALERVSTKQIVHRIGLVLSSCEQTHDDVLRSALHTEPPERLVRVPWPGASGSLVGHTSRRFPHSFGCSCLRELLAKALGLSGERGKIAAAHHEVGKAREEAFENLQALAPPASACPALQ